jgi:hypothetical protein
MATGDIIHMENIPFLNPGNILSRVQISRGYPVLDKHFQSHIPGVFITSMAATQDVGALFAFTGSVGAAARIIGAFFSSPWHIETMSDGGKEAGHTRTALSPGAIDERFAPGMWRGLSGAPAQRPLGLPSGGRHGQRSRSRLYATAPRPAPAYLHLTCRFALRVCSNAVPPPATTTRSCFPQTLARKGTCTS